MLAAATIHIFGSPTRAIAVHMSRYKLGPLFLYFIFVWKFMSQSTVKLIAQLTSHNRARLSVSMRDTSNWHTFINT